MPPSIQGGVGLELVLRTVANSSKVIKCQQFSVEKGGDIRAHAVPSLDQVFPSTTFIIFLQTFIGCTCLVEPHCK